MSKLKLIYGNKSDLLKIPFNQGAMMLSKDSQQIYFDLKNLRRTFSGLIYIATQQDRQSLSSPCDNLYFVFQSCKLYCYLSNTWVCITDKISEHTGDVDIKNADGNNVIKTDENGDVQIAGSDNSVNINGDLLYKGNQANTSNGIVVSQDNGKIPLQLMEYKHAKFNTIFFDIKNLPNNKKTFSFTQLGISQPTIVVLMDKSFLIRDDVIPVYWTNNGLQINFNDFINGGNITYDTEMFSIKYLVSNKKTQYSYTDLTTMNSISFDPYNLPNNKKSFTFVQLGISAPTLVQLVDDTGLIRDDVIPVCWTNNGLQINFSTISSTITESGHLWKIEYLITTNNIKTSQMNTISFDPYGLQNNKKQFSYSQMFLNSTTFVQLIDDTGLIRDDVVPIYWNSNGLQINFSPISSLITESGHIWKVVYLAQIKNDKFDAYNRIIQLNETVDKLKVQIDNLTVIINSLLS